MSVKSKVNFTLYMWLLTILLINFCMSRFDEGENCGENLVPHYHSPGMFLMQSKVIFLVALFLQFY